MTEADHSTDRDESLPGFPSNGIRTAISFLLFVYWFGLAVCIFSNLRDGLYSALQIKLRRTPGIVSALHWLWLDNGYDYVHFTGTFNERGEFIAVNGTDYELVAELTFADGSSNRLVLPDVSRFPRVRYQRYKNLCRASIAFVGDRDRESLLPSLLCEWLLRDQGAAKVTLQIRNHLPQGRNEASSSTSTVRDPMNDRYYRTVFRCIAQMVDGKPVYEKLEGAGDSAPAARQPGAAASAASSAPPPATDVKHPVRPRSSTPFTLPIRP